MKAGQRKLCDIHCQLPHAVREARAELPLTLRGFRVVAEGGGK